MKTDNKNVIYRDLSYKVTPIKGVKVVEHSDGKKIIKKKIKKNCKNCKHWFKGRGKGEYSEGYGECYFLSNCVCAFFPFKGAPKKIVKAIGKYQDEPILSTQDTFGCVLFKAKGKNGN